MTIREWIAELKRIYNGERREVRNTAVGWQPSDCWQEDQCPTPSGNKEFYVVLRSANEQGKTKSNSGTH